MTNEEYQIKAERIWGAFNRGLIDHNSFSERLRKLDRLSKKNSKSNVPAQPPGA